jgi:hypothetical protein
MTLSTPSLAFSHDGKDAWHWLGLAISLSYSLGLNRTNGLEASDLRRKHLERRVWWTILIRDRSLALCSGGGCARPMRIKRVDCDIDMLSMEDFEFRSSDCGDDSSEIDTVRMRLNAQNCVEKAKLCWCCDEVFVSNFWGTLTQPQPSTLAPLFQTFLPQRGVESAQDEEMDVLQPLQISTASEPEHPTFESQEDLENHISPSSSTPSASDDCFTPREYEDEDFIEEEEPELEKVVCSSSLGAGYGVDGEYDDYMEFLKVPAIDREKEKERSTWAFQLDCENDRVVEVGCAMGTHW